MTELEVLKEIVFKDKYLEYILIGVVYLIGGTVTAGAVVAEFQNSFKVIARKDYRKDLAIGIFLGFVWVPVISWIFIFFMTGFYQHGISLKPLYPKVKSNV